MTTQVPDLHLFPWWKYVTNHSRFECKLNTFSVCSKVFDEVVINSFINFKYFFLRVWSWRQRLLPRGQTHAGRRRGPPQCQFPRNPSESETDKQKRNQKLDFKLSWESLNGCFKGLTDKWRLREVWEWKHLQDFFVLLWRKYLDFWPVCCSLRSFKYGWKLQDSYQLHFEKKK